jgi:hypothetical protein
MSTLFEDSLNGKGEPRAAASAHFPPRAGYLAMAVFLPVTYILSNALLSKLHTTYVVRSSILQVPEAKRWLFFFVMHGRRRRQ